MSYIEVLNDNIVGGLQKQASRMSLLKSLGRKATVPFVAGAAGSGAALGGAGLMAHNYLHSGDVPKDIEAWVKKTMTEEQIEKINERLAEYMGKLDLTPVVEHIGEGLQGAFYDAAEKVDTVKMVKTLRDKAISEGGRWGTLAKDKGSEIYNDVSTGTSNALGQGVDWIKNNPGTAAGGLAAILGTGYLANRMMSSDEEVPSEEEEQEKQASTAEKLPAEEEGSLISRLMKYLSPKDIAQKQINDTAENLDFSPVADKAEDAVYDKIDNFDTGRFGRALKDKTLKETGVLAGLIGQQAGETMDYVKSKTSEGLGALKTNTSNALGQGADWVKNNPSMAVGGLAGAFGTGYLTNKLLSSDDDEDDEQEKQASTVKKKEDEEEDTGVMAPHKLPLWLGGGALASYAAGKTLVPDSSYKSIVDAESALSRINKGELSPGELINDYAYHGGNLSNSSFAGLTFPSIVEGFRRTLPKDHPNAWHEYSGDHYKTFAKGPAYATTKLLLSGADGTELPEGYTHDMFREDLLGRVNNLSTDVSGQNLLEDVTGHSEMYKKLSNGDTSVIPQELQKEIAEKLTQEEVGGVFGQVLEKAKAHKAEEMTKHYIPGYMGTLGKARNMREVLTKYAPLILGGAGATALGGGLLYKHLQDKREEKEEQ